MADLKFTADYSDLSKTVDALIQIGKASNDTAKAFAQAGRQITSWQQRFAVEQGKVNAQLEKNYQKQALANKSAKESASIFQSQARQIELLAQKYKPLYAASMQYERALEEVNQAHKLGVLSAQQHEAALERLNQEFANGTGQFAQYSTQASMRLNQLGVGVQQVGYQVGDFLVQVQSGTNALVAFGQQATQLVGVLPMFASQLGLTATSAIAIASGLGIAIPLVTAIGAAFMRTRQNSDAASDSLDAYAEASKAVKKAQQELADEIERTNLGLKDQNELVLTRELANVNQEIETLKKAVAASDIESVGFNQTLLDQAIQRRDVIQEELDIHNETLRVQDLRAGREAAMESFLNAQQTYLEEQQRIRSENGKALEEQLRLEQEVHQFAMSQTWEKQQQRDASMKLLEAAIEVYEQEKAIREEIGDAATNALKLAGVDIASGVSEAAKAAAILATNLGISLNAAYSMINLRGGADPTASRGDAMSEAVRRRNDALGIVNQADLPEIKDPKKLRGSGGQKKTPYIEQLLKEADYKRKIVGLSDQEVRRREIMFELSKREEVASEAQIEQIIKLEEETRKLTEAQAQAERQQKAFTDILMSGMESLITGSKSVEDAFKDTIRNILLNVYRQKVLQPLSDIGSNLLMGLLGQANGGAWSKGVQMYADGGVVSSPTMFGHSGGLGVMGEAGPEAIMPLKRGANGKLGVQMEGNAGNVTVNNTFNVTGNDNPAAVRAELAKLMPHIEKATVNSVINARKRGGQMKAAFR